MASVSNDELKRLRIIELWDALPQHKKETALNALSVICHESLPEPQLPYPVSTHQ
jgi:hypothetical protein